MLLFGATFAGCLVFYFGVIAVIIIIVTAILVVCLQPFLFQCVKRASLFLRQDNSKPRQCFHGLDKEIIQRTKL